MTTMIRSTRPRQARTAGRFLVLLILAFATSTATAEELIATGATWSYLDDGSNQGTRWREVEFDDSAWRSGPAQLGFGDGDEATTLTYGHTTYYFRHEITVDNPGEIPGLALSILRDDGAVVYLNGNEVYRTNMPRGTIGFRTLASSTVESGAFLDLSFPSDHLVTGKNVVAVEVHQVSTSSTDVSFDFSLETTTTAPGDIVPLGATWSYLDDRSDPGTAWRATEFDDSGWQSGPAELGFGDGDEATVITRGALAYYFRHDFEIDDVDSVAALELGIRRDDGAIVYLNGTEVVRSNMAAGEVSYDTLASNANDDGTELHTYEVSADLLVAGENVLAAEVHQVSSLSSDLSFDLRATRIVAAESPTLERRPYLQLGTPSSMIVRWRTDGYTTTRLSYGTEVGALDKTIESDRLATEHEVEITGLDSRTKYFYEVGNLTTVFAGNDADHFFKTSPAVGSRDPVRIWVIGDSGQCAVDSDGCQDAMSVMDEYFEWTAANGNRLADIILMLGDNAYNDGTDAEYTKGLFGSFGKALRNHVLWPVPGNHEFGDSDSPSQSGPYYEAFTLPKAAEAGGIASGTEAYYSFDYGNVHFAALDSHDTDRTAPLDPTTNICPMDGSAGAMYDWLCEDLAATTQDFVFAFWHHPPYTKGSHDSDAEVQLFEMRERFVPVLEYHGADVNLTGHSHSYERSALIDGHYGVSSTYDAATHAKDASAGDPESGGYTKDAGANQGTIYSVVGSSSKTTGTLTQHPIMVSWHHIEGSAVIDIHASRLDGHFIDKNGAVRDQYRLTKNVGGAGEHVVAMFPAARDPDRQGFARVINHSARPGVVDIDAVDDDGNVFGPVSLNIDALETVHFNSDDLEDGNEAKGLPTGTEQGSGDWRLNLSSHLDIEVLAYVRTSDGFLTAMHDVVPPGEDGGHHVAILNPGKNTNQVSRLRLINPNDQAVEATITGIDDAGATPGSEVRVSIPARASTTLDAQQLESYDDGDGLGVGAGKWQLVVESDEPIRVVNLMALAQTGHLTNLSTAPENLGDAGHIVPLVPAASDSLGREGFVRVINHSAEAGHVSIEAFDDTDREFSISTLTLAANETKHFNSTDLEMGSDAKGLTGGTGAGQGDWRLILSSDLDIEVLAYIRTDDGFLTAMHDTVRREGDRHRVPMFNPGLNTRQVSTLRVANEGDTVADATIWGIDDLGERSSGTVSISVAPGTSQTLTAQEMEDRVGGGLGDGTGKWQLVVESAQPLTVMSLLSSPTGHLTNLSTAPALQFAPADDAMFADRAAGKRLVWRNSARNTDFLDNGRIQDGTVEGTYTYIRDGANDATIQLQYGDDVSDSYKCALETTFDSRTGGTLEYACDDGASGASDWWLTATPSTE